MDKPTSLNEYYETLNEISRDFFNQIRTIIHQAYPNVCETLFVSNPYYYLKEYEKLKPHHRPSIMFVYYKDHVNVFAHAIKEYISELEIYNVTDKDTLQIYYGKPLLSNILVEIFKKSLKT